MYGESIRAHGSIKHKLNNIKINLNSLDTDPEADLDLDELDEEDTTF